MTQTTEERRRIGTRAAGRKWYWKHKHKIDKSRKSAYNSEYRTKNKERLLLQKKEYYKANRPAILERQKRYYDPARQYADRLKNYGITTAEHATILERQGGRCAICAKAQKERLVVDHCHNSKKVRGLLCKRCNSGLGFLGDSIDGLRAAAAYLERA